MTQVSKSFFREVFNPVEAGGGGSHITRPDALLPFSGKKATLVSLKIRVQP